MKVTIDRGDGDETFEVPDADGRTVLDALAWIREHRDPSLAVRFSCRSANACRECITVIDGRRDYACTVVPTGPTRVAPLPNQPRLHDLVVDH